MHYIYSIDMNLHKHGRTLVEALCHQITGAYLGMQARGKTSGQTHGYKPGGIIVSPIPFFVYTRIKEDTDYVHFQMTRCNHLLRSKCAACLTRLLASLGSKSQRRRHGHSLVELILPTGSFNFILV